jgi:serine/threonine-protein kinase
MTCSTIGSSGRTALVRIGVVALALCMAAPALAAPTAADAALAEALFRDARRLMGEKRYPEACAKFAESQRLDPSGGTLLNLAVCHEAEGKLATAWVELNEALAVARRDGRADREKVVRQRLAALDTRLPRLVVVVEGAARLPGLEIRRDGELIREPAWGLPQPLDPGSYTVVASAPGRKAWEVRVTLAPGKTARVAVVPLEPLPAAPASAPVTPAAAPVTPAPPPAVARVPAPAPAAAPPPSTDEPPRRGLHGRVWSLVAGGAGVVLIGVGSAYGASAMSKNDESKSHCRTNVLCDAEGVRLRDDALAAGRLSTWFFVGGAVAVVAGGALWFLLAPKREGRTPQVTMAPVLAPGAAALMLRGAL